jgi:hypothetical protein
MGQPFIKASRGECLLCFCNLQLYQYFVSLTGVRVSEYVTGALPPTSWLEVSAAHEKGWGRGMAQGKKKIQSQLDTFRLNAYRKHLLDNSYEPSLKGASPRQRIRYSYVP